MTKGEQFFISLITAGLLGFVVLALGLMLTGCADDNQYTVRTRARADGRQWYCERMRSFFYNDETIAICSDADTCNEICAASRAEGQSCKKEQGPNE